MENCHSQQKHQEFPLLDLKVNLKPESHAMEMTGYHRPLLPFPDGF
jgi:hypothetical protein